MQPTPTQIPCICNDPTQLHVQRGWQERTGQMPLVSLSAHHFPDAKLIVVFQLLQPCQRSSSSLGSLPHVITHMTGWTEVQGSHTLCSCLSGGTSVHCSLTDGGSVYIPSFYLLQGGKKGSPSALGDHGAQLSMPVVLPRHSLHWLSSCFYVKFPQPYQGMAG